jgi:hypothetical protein
MNKVFSFLKRLPFLEVHPAIVSGVILIPIALTAFHTYSYVHQDEVPKEYVSLINETQEMLQTSYENIVKKYENVDKIMRPNRYSA